MFVLFSLFFVSILKRDKSTIFFDSMKGIKKYFFIRVYCFMKCNIYSINAIMPFKKTIKKQEWREIFYYSKKINKLI